MTALTAHRRSDRGFTMIELVLVIVLLGIVSIVVVPSFNSKPFIEQGFYDEVVSAARYAQKLAVASGCPARLNVAGNRYAVEQSSDCGTTSWDIVAAHPSRSGGFAHDAPSGVTLSSATITFAANGSSSGGGVTVGTRSFSVLATGYVDAG